MKYGTIFYQSNIKHISFILLAYCFTERNRNHSQTSSEASLPQENYMDRTLSSTTIQRRYNFFSWICVKDYRKTRTKIGEEGVILEGDESMFGTDLEKVTNSGNGIMGIFLNTKKFGNKICQPNYLFCGNKGTFCTSVFLLLNL